MNEDSYQRVLAKIHNFLSFRDRTEKELSDALDKYVSSEKLLTEGEKKEQKDKILSELEEEGFVDDAAFAKTYIEDKISSLNPVGKRAVWSFLSKKGVPADVIESALENHYGEENEIAAATKAADKRIKLIHTASEMERKQKLINYLLQRGFSPPAVFAVVDTKFKKD